MLAFMQNKFSLLMQSILLFAAWSFAGVDFNGDCIKYTGSPDSRCVYLPLELSQIIGLYVEDPPGSHNPKPNSDLYIYAPDAGTEGIEYTILGGGTVVNGEKQTSPDDGYVKINVFGAYPKYNSPLGVTVDNVNYNVIYVYNFYKPEILFCEDEKCDYVITDVSNLQVNVGDTIKVYVQARVPVGPEAGKLDEKVERQYLISTPNSALEFLNIGKAPMGTAKVNGQDMYLGDLKKGTSAFYVTARTAVSKVDFTLNSYPVDQGDGTYDFKLKEKFPGKLQFVNYGLPTLDSAAIFDSNGDGIGDSIVAYYDGMMEGVSFSKIQYNWPDGEKTFTNFTGEQAIVNQMLELSGIKSKLPKEVGQGTLKMQASSSVSGVTGSMETDIKDRIGPVIQTATIVKGEGNSKSDTIVVHFNKDIDPSWTSGSAFLLNGVPLSMTAVDKSVDGDGSVWKFVVPTGTAKNGDELELATSCKKDACKDGLIQAADGNKVGKNNPAELADSGRNYMDNEKNGFYDRNGDGTMDGATIAFESPITKDDLKDMSVVLYWVDNQGNRIAIKPDLTNPKFVKISEDGLVLEIVVDSTKYDVKKMLTYVDTTGIKDDSLKYGFATVSKPVVVDGKATIETYDCLMHDRMSPVIAGTFLQPESFQKMEADVLTITFSEPVNQETISDLTALSECFSFKVNGKWVSIPFSSLSWNDDGKSVKIHLENGVDLADRLNPADSIKFDVDKALLKDLEDNGLSGKAPTVMVQGDPRVLMQTTSLASLDRAALLADRAAFTERFVPADEEMDEEMQKSLGVLMDISFATVMGEDGDEASSIDLENVGLSWELKVFTNLGAYVGGASNKIKCNDKAFEGNCFEHAKKLYLRWNMRSDSGRKVGVGVYVAQFKINVYGAKNAFKVERIYNWGIRAGKDGLSLGD